MQSFTGVIEPRPMRCCFLGVRCPSIRAVSGLWWRPFVRGCRSWQRRSRSTSPSGHTREGYGDGDSMVLEVDRPGPGTCLQRLLSSSDVHEGVARVRPEMPCSARTAEDIILEHGVQVVQGGDHPMSGDLAPPAPGVVAQCFRVALGGTDGEDEQKNSYGDPVIEVGDGQNLQCPVRYRAEKSTRSVPARVAQAPL